MGRDANPRGAARGTRLYRFKAVNALDPGLGLWRKVPVISGGGML